MLNLLQVLWWTFLCVYGWLGGWMEGLDTSLTARSHAKQNGLVTTASVTDRQTLAPNAAAIYFKFYSFVFIYL